MFDMREQIMTYASDHVISALRAARQAKQLSQRRLSQTAGVPQSHLSKIEQGQVDLQLSSLIELARDLDLELVLVPRRLVPAVEALLRSAAGQRGPAAAGAANEVRRLKSVLRRWQSLPGAGAELERLESTLSELARFPLAPADLQKLRRVSTLLINSSKDRQNAAPVLRRAAEELRKLRNTVVHRPAEEPSAARPAYSLDEEDDDA
jgi:transcriptional regulator with XRE-family HTH domain